MSGYRCERATSAHADGLLALFESAGSGCFCNYWHVDGDKLIIEGDAARLMLKPGVAQLKPEKPAKKPERRAR